MKLYETGGNLTTESFLGDCLTFHNYEQIVISDHAEGLTSSQCR